jgi:hypothetical protein
VHVGKDGDEVKFWLGFIKIARTGKFRQSDLGAIEQIIAENQTFLIHAWEKEQSKHVNS